MIRNAVAAGADLSLYEPLRRYTDDRGLVAPPPPTEMLDADAVKALADGPVHAALRDVRCGVPDRLAAVPRSVYDVAIQARSELARTQAELEEQRRRTRTLGTRLTDLTLRIEAGEVVPQTTPQPAPVQEAPAVEGVYAPHAVPAAITRARGV